MIGICVFVRSRRHNSSPSMLGMARSVMTRSGDHSFMISSAASPSLATRMSYPWLERDVRRTRVICDSSSTTRMCLCSKVYAPPVRPAGFLRHDVHVHRRGVAQKLMDRLKIEISFPNPRRTPLQLRLQQTDRQLNGWVERAVSLQRNPVRTARHRLLPR